MGQVRIGTSGWQYRDWRGSFYPRREPSRRWLELYAACFTTVEANGTFYRLPERSTFEDWRERTPADFEIAVKASRFLTHVRRLRDPEPAVRRMLGHAKGLGRKLGPVLLQLPPTLARDVGRLDETLSAFPRSTKIAVELRHESWLDDEVACLLERHGAATCLADRRGPVAPQWRTAGWGYVRLHEGGANPSPRYGSKALQRWAERIAEQFGPAATVYAYFNNDAGGCAPGNAKELARACERAGLNAPLGSGFASG